MVNLLRSGHGRHGASRLFRLAPAFIEPVAECCWKGKRPRRAGARQGLSGGASRPRGMPTPSLGHRNLPPYS